MNMNISELSLEEKIGQMILPGFRGKELNSDITKLIRDYHAGNIILFARNISSPEQLFRLNHDLQALAISENNVPLFIASDEEGGSVSRINNAGFFFPGAMTVTSSGGINEAFNVGTLLGEKLSALGININLAPVLDVNSNPGHPTLTSRSYSDNPLLAADMAESFVKGIQSKNIIATAKHFPGHGRSRLDTHLERDIVDLTRQDMFNLELIPFLRAIDAGISAIMTSHVTYKAFDSEYPSTLSEKVLTEFLRKDIGFKGLIISDCLEMQAVSKYYGSDGAALLAVKAGCDILIVSHTFETQVKCIERLIKAVRTGEIKEERINASVERILSYKKLLNIAGAQDKTFEDNKPVIADKRYSLYCQDIYDKAITVYRWGDRLPIHDEDAVFLYTDAVNLSQVDDSMKISFAEIVKENFPLMELVKFEISPADDAVTAIITKVKNKRTVIICTYNAYHNEGQIKLVNSLEDECANLIVISMRNPYDLLKFPEVSCYIIAYEYTPPSMKAVMKLLSGKITGNSKCPVRLI